MKLEEMRAVAEKATPGPWKRIEGSDDSVHLSPGYWWDAAHIPHCTRRERGERFEVDDARFIATFNPARMLKLLTVIEFAKTTAKSTISLRDYSDAFEGMREAIRDLEADHG